MDYHTIVVKNLDPAPFGQQYVMATVWPRWESRIPDIGEVGYLTYNSVTAGVDKWYDHDTNQFIPYNYSNNIFVKFVKEEDKTSKDIIL